MSNFSKCIGTMNRAAGRELSDEELTRIFDLVSDAAREQRAHLREPTMALADAIATKAQQRMVAEREQHAHEVAMVILRATSKDKEMPAPPDATVGKLRSAVATTALETAGEFGQFLMIPKAIGEDLAAMVRGTHRGPAGLAEASRYSLTGSDDVLAREAARAIAEHPDLQIIGEDGKPKLMSDELRRVRNENEAERRLFTPELLEQAAWCFLPAAGGV